MKSVELFLAFSLATGIALSSSEIATGNQHEASSEGSS